MTFFWLIFPLLKLKPLSNEKWQVAVIFSKTLDTHNMNPIDSNINFCITLDTHSVNSNRYVQRLT